MFHNKAHVSLLQKRSSGILLPLFSLPGPFGIGDMGRSAFDFVSFLQKSGQSLWQILPVGPVSFACGNSPYMSFSALAGNPLYISPDMLVQDGLLEASELPHIDFSEYTVDYLRAGEHKHFLLQSAWRRFQRKASWRETFQDFLASHPWVADHALFLALKNLFQQQPWYQWPGALRMRYKTAMQEARKNLDQEINFFIFEQYLFFNQWQKLKQDANARGVHLIGDLPIYVALDSVDVWSHQELFYLDSKSGLPSHVAGVPPDYFSKTGQLWGNPLYRWNSESESVRAALWQWWEDRLRMNFTLCDIVRMDHFRGFAAYWAIPASEKTAVRGAWRPGPGQSFFFNMEERLGKLPVIAEDLGIITPDVEEMRLACGYPGMKILLFAFDGNPDNLYLPYNMEKNSVIYTGTHDNDTAVGWYLDPAVPWENKRRAKAFANQNDEAAGIFHRDLAYLALSSPANTAILPMQDVLGFGNDCRINVPGTVEGNWQWRCAPRFFSDETAIWLRDLTERFGRLPRPEKMENDEDPEGGSDTMTDLLDPDEHVLK